MVGSELFPDLRITGKQEIMGNGLTTSRCSVGNDPNCTSRNPNMFYNSLKMMNSSNSHEVHLAISLEAPL